MTEKEILTKIKTSVFGLLKNEATGHDYFHVERVVNTTKIICDSEKHAYFYPSILAWLHDVGDYKIHDGIDKTEQYVNQILKPLNFDNEFIQNVIKDIHLIGYNGGFNQTTNKKEIWIVQDADKLDAMGAIGIARAFAYGGKKGRLLHHPNFKTIKITSIKDYKNSDAPTIQHFYDKLLKLKDLMKTKKGKALAQERHDFMLGFLNQFYQEWDLKL